MDTVVGEPERMKDYRIYYQSQGHWIITEVVEDCNGSIIESQYASVDSLEEAFKQVRWLKNPNHFGVRIL